MADLIPFTKYLDNNEHWNQLSDQRDNLRKQAKDKGKAENKLMMAQAYTFAASLLEQKIIFEWECDCSSEEVKAVSKWTGVNLEVHIEYIADVIDNLRYEASKYGAEAQSMLAHCRECDKDADELQEQVSAMYQKLSEEWEELKNQHDQSKQQENDEAN